MKRIQQQFKFLMQTDSKFLGLVTKKFNEFFLVEIIERKNFALNSRFLCKTRKSVKFRNQIIYVGDKVVIDHLDLKNKTAIIESLIKRKNLLKRPSVANISNVYVIFSVEEPKLNLSQVNRFLISAESLQVDVTLVLTKCDLISKKQITIDGDILNYDFDGQSDSNIKKILMNNKNIVLLELYKNFY